MKKRWSRYVEQREYKLYVDDLTKKISSLNDVPDLALGAEVYCDHDISRHDNIAKLCIDNTKYLLIEFPFTKNLKHLSDWIYSLNTKDITVIIAHIERYPEYIHILNEMQGLDVILQVNASSFLSIYGRKRIKKIMQFGKRIFVGSDMHNTTIRSCKMKAAFEIANKKGFGRDMFVRYNKENVISL